MLKKTKSIINDILSVSIGNVFSLVASVVTGLIVPIVLGTSEYGYYRIFTLYMNYTSFLHFGFIDGLLLKNGGTSFNKLNKIKYRSNSMIFIISQLIVASFIILLSIFVNSKVYKTLFIMVGVGTFLVNVTSYYRFISQIVLRFKEFSIRNIIQNLLVIVLTVLMFILYKLNVLHIIKIHDYIIYILIMLFVYFVMFVIYIKSYQNITFGVHDSLINGIKRAVYYCRLGIFLTISYQISALIMIIDNQFVSMFFKASVYGKYSFAYSVTNIVTAISGAVSTVLLPYLKQDDIKHVIHIYSKMMSCMLLFIYFLLITYFPLCPLIRLILPKYAYSLLYLKMFFPGLGVSCCVSLIMFNYYNVLNKSKFYFYISIIVLFISAIMDLFICIVFKNSVLVSFGSLISLIIWYILSEYFLVKWYHVKFIKNLVYMLLMSLVFLCISTIPNFVVGLICYTFMYFVVSLFMFFNLLKKIEIKLLKKC